MWIVFAHFVGEGAGTVIDFRLRLRLLYINDIFQAVMAAYNLPQDLFPHSGEVLSVLIIITY